jgi:predicted acyl esterase
MSDETINIGREAGTPVTPGCDRHSSVFSGKIDWVQIDLDDTDHMISPEERLRVVMARQAEKSDEGRVKRNSLTGANRGH